MFMNLLFMCDSRNSIIRVIYTARLVSKRKIASTLEPSISKSVQEEDGIPIAGKYTVTPTLSLISTSRTPLIRLFSICCGRIIFQDYPDLFLGDTEQGKVFKILNRHETCKSVQWKTSGTIPAASTSVRILPVALVFHQDRLFFANGATSELGIYVLHAIRGTLLSTITSPLLPSPSGMCIVDNCLMVS